MGEIYWRGDGAEKQQVNQESKMWSDTVCSEQAAGR